MGCSQVGVASHGKGLAFQFTQAIVTGSTSHCIIRQCLQLKWCKAWNLCVLASATLPAGGCSANACQEDLLHLLPAGPSARWACHRCCPSASAHLDQCG